MRREDVIAEFVTTILGRTPTHVARIKAFETNEVYEVDMDVQRLIVKATLHAPLLAEAWACGVGASAGCAAPPLMGLGQLDDRTSAFIMPRIEGTPISSERGAFVAAGRSLRNLHNVTRPRFGNLADATWHARDAFVLSHASWLDFLERICADARRLDPNSGAKPIAEAATSGVAAHADALARVDVASLCHGDLKAAHILVDAGRLTGLIDWGDAVFADPLWDIARYVHRADALSLSWLLEGYDPRGTLAADLAWRLPLYSALWMLVDAIVDHRLGHRVDLSMNV